MAMPTRKLRSIFTPPFGLTLCGLALTLLRVAGAPAPAAAFGGFGFGHMGGGFGGPGMGMGRGMGQPMMTPRRGGSTYVARQPGGMRGNPGGGDGAGNGNRWPPRHPVIGHPIIVPVPGAGAPPAANIPPTPPPTGTAGLNGGGGGAGAGGGGGGGGGMPPRGERRFVPDEVIAAFLLKRDAAGDRATRTPAQSDAT
jgi:hypothetical protein